MHDEKEAPAKSLAELKSPTARDLATPDQKIDMFSSRGFALAQRIAQAFSTADAVPACFRAQTLKKSKSGDTWVDNPSAFGNCLVAIETAQSVGMSITAVMQNSNIIEGKLSWSGQFKIGAVNASGRFTPLRYDIKNTGMMKATYKEKGAWNDNARRFDMTERTIEIENLVCVAWALPIGMPFPPGVYSLDQARASGLPVIEGPPVSMKLAVEEGWYAKSGSKWQTEMKHKMLTIRAGAYFSDIHAPDIVMGMGRTSDELEDMSTIDLERQPNGQYVAANLDELRAGAVPEQAKARNQAAETVDVRENAQPEESVDPETGEVKTETEAVKPEPKPAINDTARAPYESVAAAIHKALNVDALAEAADLIKTVDDQGLRDELGRMYRTRHAELDNVEAVAADTPPKTRARRSAPGAVE